MQFEGLLARRLIPLVAGGTRPLCRVWQSALRHAFVALASFQVRGQSARLHPSRRLEAERVHATRVAGAILGVLIMSEQIPSSLVDSLIALGRAGVPGTVPGIRNAHEAFDEIVRRWTWSKSTAGRTPEDVAALIKGIVLLSRGVGGLRGGSVSPVIGLCWELRRH